MTKGILVPGSKPLSNHKHELFAQQLSRGDVSVIDAYGNAGYARTSANASRLNQQAHIQERVLFLRSAAARVANVDGAWVMRKLAQHAEHLTEVVEVDEEVASRDARGREIKSTIRVKKPGPLFNAPAGNTALKLLGLEFGLFKERIELGGQVQVQNAEVLKRMTPEERAQMRALIEAAAARVQPPANDNPAGLGAHEESDDVAAEA